MASREQLPREQLVEWASAMEAQQRHSVLAVIARLDDTQCATYALVPEEHRLAAIHSASPGFWASVCGLLRTAIQMVTPTGEHPGLPGHGFWASVCGLLRTAIQMVTPTGYISLQQGCQSDRQSPDEHMRVTTPRTANLQMRPGRSSANVPSVSGMVVRPQRSTPRGPHQLHATVADVRRRWSLQQVYEAAIEAVTEAIEYDADVDMSALDQIKGSRCDLDVRMANTLKYALPAALKERESRACAQSGIGPSS